MAGIARLLKGGALARRPTGTATRESRRDHRCSRVDEARSDFAARVCRAVRRREHPRRAADLLEASEREPPARRQALVDGRASTSTTRLRGVHSQRLPEQDLTIIPDGVVSLLKAHRPPDVLLRCVHRRALFC